MGAYAWFTMDKIKEVQKRLDALEARSDLQIGSSAALIEVVACVRDLIAALVKDPGPTINHDM